MVCQPTMVRRRILWSLPPPGAFKFNVDEATRGRRGPTGNEGVLHNNKGEVLFMFLKHEGVCDSNESKVLGC